MPAGFVDVKSKYVTDCVPVVCLPRCVTQAIMGCRELGSMMVLWMILLIAMETMTLPVVLWGGGSTARDSEVVPVTEGEATASRLQVRQLC